MQLLGTAASGLQSQMARLDAISNNIANLDTTGYERTDVSFADMLTQVYGQSPSVSGLSQRLTPAGLSLGTGAYALPGQRYFEQGNLTTTNNPLDMAIAGDGFFMVSGSPSGVGFTRAGNFHISRDVLTGHMYLSAKSGAYVLNDRGQPIDLTGVNPNSLSVSANGDLSAQTLTGKPVSLGRLGLAYVGNPTNALHSLGDDVYQLNTGFTAATNATGGATTSQLIGPVKGGMLESSNVNLTQEMTDMLETQHNFNASAEAVNIADKMMGIADTIR